ncbi:MAG: ArsC family reductase [Blastomonas fulva]|uniref:ArsC family reductase n=1 Tax=Blastomonas TaxID=150203 RepID=UPI00083DDE6B|nr:ArsC family reductase [Blastomonas sp. RAC04]AOG01890.1 transcriptional regulator, Spx/MgsR family protein [Blastomonas sp. RAC04]
MTKITLHGIPNCDTMKKARVWLEAQGLAYDFHDYKKDGITSGKLNAWADVVGWEVLLNKAGTTFRKLPDADKADITRDKAIALMVEQPSLIKRPVLEHPGGVLVGFKPDVYASALG